ncbi:MAG: hypothetical protein WCH34_12275 [Bacteroidota bacterium]
MEKIIFNFENIQRNENKIVSIVHNCNYNSTDKILSNKYNHDYVYDAIYCSQTNDKNVYVDSDLIKEWDLIKCINEDGSEKQIALQIEPNESDIVYVFKLKIYDWVKDGFIVIDCIPYKNLYKTYKIEIIGPKADSKQWYVTRKND